MADKLKVCWLPPSCFLDQLVHQPWVPPPLCQHFLEPLDCARAMREQQPLEAGSALSIRPWPGCRHLHTVPTPPPTVTRHCAGYLLRAQARAVEMGLFPRLCPKRGVFPTSAHLQEPSAPLLLWL